jgi:hypothetical protein
LLYLHPATYESISIISPVIQVDRYSFDTAMRAIVCIRRLANLNRRRGEEERAEREERM